MNQLVRKESIEELCGHRSRAIDLYRQGAELLEEATKAHSRAVVGKGGYIQSPELRSHHNNRVSGADEFVAAMTRQIDQDMWRGFINGTPIGSLMDREERDKFEKEVEKSPPSATPENVKATLERLAGESDTIFRRGLVNAFAKLCRDYKSNDGFKIGERTVLTYGAVYEKLMDWFRLGHNREDELRDIDRVMHVLDGKPAPDYQQGLVATLRQAMYDFRKTRKTEVTTPYWRCRFFKNGNMHLWCLRDDLRDKANKLIAEHFGETLGAGHGVANKAPAAEAPREFKAGDQDYFRTPPEIAALAVERAEIDEQHVCLEPSAGEGAIVEEMRKFSTCVHAIEIDADRYDTLVQRFAGGIGEMQMGDFLKITPVPAYDRIVMNPPFSKGQEVMHVWHALKCLKRGGRLVAIMSIAVRFRGDTLYRELQGELQRLGAEIEDLPPDAFKASGTKVRTVLVTVNKP